MTHPKKKFHSQPPSIKLSVRFEDEPSGEGQAGSLNCEKCASEPGLQELQGQVEEAKGRRLTSLVLSGESSKEYKRALDDERDTSSQLENALHFWHQDHEREDNSHGVAVHPLSVSTDEAQVSRNVANERGTSGIWAEYHPTYRRRLESEDSTLRTSLGLRGSNVAGPDLEDSIRKSISTLIKLHKEPALTAQKSDNFRNLEARQNFDVLDRYYSAFSDQTKNIQAFHHNASQELMEELKKNIPFKDHTPPASISPLAVDLKMSTPLGTTGSTRVAANLLPLTELPNCRDPRHAMDFESPLEPSKTRYVPVEGTNPYVQTRERPGSPATYLRDLKTAFLTREHQLYLKNALATPSPSLDFSLMQSNANVKQELGTLLRYHESEAALHLQEVQSRELQAHHIGTTGKDDLDLYYHKKPLEPNNNEEFFSLRGRYNYEPITDEVAAGINRKEREEGSPTTQFRQLREESQPLTDIQQENLIKHHTAEADRQYLHYQVHAMKAEHIRRALKQENPFEGVHQALFDHLG